MSFKRTPYNQYLDQVGKGYDQTDLLVRLGESEKAILSLKKHVSEIFSALSEIKNQIHLIQCDIEQIELQTGVDLI